MQNGWQYTTVRDFYCGGFALLTTSDQCIAQIGLFLEEIGVFVCDVVGMRVYAPASVSMFWSLGRSVGV